MSAGTTWSTSTPAAHGAVASGPIPPAARRGAVAVLLAAATLTVMAAALIAPALPGLEAEFADVPRADLLVRLVLTLPAPFIVVAAPVLGAVIDRIGRRGVLLASLALYGLAGSSGFFLEDLYTILAGRALLGVAVGGIFVSSTALIADYSYGEQRTRLLGLQAAFMSIGGAVFIAAGGLLASVSPRGPFLLYALALVLLPFAARVITEPAPQRPAAGHTATTRAVVPWALVSLILVVALFAMMTLYLVPTQLPFHLADLSGAGPTTSGLTMALLNAVGATVSLNFRRIRVRLSFTSLVVAVFLALGTGLALVALARGLPLTLVGLSIAGIGTGLLIPTLNSWIAHGTPAALRGRMLGVLSTAVYLGQFLSPLASQPIARAATVSTAFAAGAVLCAVVAVVIAVIALSPRRRAVLEREAAD